MFADYEPSRIAQQEALREHVRLQLEQDQTGGLKRNLLGGLVAFGGALGPSPFDNIVLEALEGDSDVPVDYLGGEALYYTGLLRPRETQVVRLSYGLAPETLGQRYRDPEIAYRLGIKETTVRSHRSRGLGNIRRELQATTDQREERLNYFAWQSSL